MAKKKRSNKIEGPFVPVLKEMITSPAYEKLTNASRVAHLLLMAQCRSFEQNEVKFPFSHAQKYMHRNTFNQAIKQLEEYGFIEKSFCGGLFRRTNVYRFISAWRGFKAPL